MDAPLKKIVIVTKPKLGQVVLPYTRVSRYRLPRQHHGSGQEIQQQFQSPRPQLWCRGQGWLRLRKWLQAHRQKVSHHFYLLSLLKMTFRPEQHDDVTYWHWKFFTSRKAGQHVLQVEEQGGVESFSFLEKKLRENHQKKFEFFLRNQIFFIKFDFFK